MMFGATGRALDAQSLSGAFGVKLLNGGLVGGLTKGRRRRRRRLGERTGNRKAKVYRIVNPRAAKKSRELGLDAVYGADGWCSDRNLDANGCRVRSGSNCRTVGWRVA